MAPLLICGMAEGRAAAGMPASALSLALALSASERKYTVSEGMSDLRSRKGGVLMVMTARR